MATNDDLENFFAKKDMKAKKGKKASVVNNEELHKQLVIVTSATSAFKDNPDLDEDDDEETVLASAGAINATHTHSHGHAHAHAGPSNSHHVGASTTAPIAEVVEVEAVGGEEDGGRAVLPKTQTSSKSTGKKHRQHQQKADDDMAPPQVQQQNSQQDEWEDFEDEQKKKLEALKLKWSSRGGDPSQYDDEDEDEFYGEEGHQGGAVLSSTGAEVDQLDDDPNQPRSRRRAGDQLKERPVWKLDQVAAVAPAPVEEVAPVAAPPLPSAPETRSGDEKKVETPAAAAAYLPPQRRSTAVTAVGTTGSSSSERSQQQRAGNKKKEPNLASVEEFPSLAAAAKKK